MAKLLPGVSFSGYANVQFSADRHPTPFQILPHFRVTSQDDLRRFLAAESLAVSNSLAPILDGLSTSDHLVFPSSHTAVVAAIAHLARARGVATLPHVHLRFYDVGDGGDGPNVGVAAAIQDLLSIPGVREKVHILTELPEQAEHVREAWGADAEWFPFVHPSIFAAGATPAASVPPPAFRIGFLGQARQEKGIGLTPAIIDAFRKRAPDLADRITWVVQAAGDSARGRAAATPVLEFGGRNPGLIEFHPGGLEGEAYDEILRSVDILVLPYEPSRYLLRGSGVATEATFAGKPFVYSAGTVLGSLGGRSAISAKSVFAVADALIEMCRDYVAFSAHAAEARDDLHRRILDARFIARLSKPAEDRQSMRDLAPA